MVHTVLSITVNNLGKITGLKLGHSAAPMAVPGAYIRGNLLDVAARLVVVLGGSDLLGVGVNL